MSSTNQYVLVNEYILDLEKLIELNEAYITSFRKWIRISLTVGLATIGLAVLLYSRLQVLAPSIVGTGGSLINGGIAALSYVAIIPRRTDIVKYGHMKRRLENLESLSDEDQRRTLDLADNMLGT